MDYTFMIRVSFYWSEHRVEYILLCFFATNHTICIYNHTPNQLIGLIPMELLTQTNTDNKYLLQYHMCGMKNLNMEIKYLNGIIAHDLANFGVLLTSIPP